MKWTKKKKKKKKKILGSKEKDKSGNFGEGKIKIYLIDLISLWFSANIQNTCTIALINS